MNLAAIIAGVKKLIPFIILLVVVAVGFAGKQAVQSYQGMATDLSNETSAKNNVLGVNANLNQTIIDLTKDKENRSNANLKIATDTGNANAAMDSLRADLERAIAERDAARKAVPPKAPGNVVSTSCTSEERSSDPLDEDTVELKYAWMAFCKAMPNSAQCIKG